MNRKEVVKKFSPAVEGMLDTSRSIVLWRIQEMIAACERNQERFEDKEFLASLVMGLLVSGVLAARNFEVPTPLLEEIYQAAKDAPDLTPDEWADVFAGKRRFDDICRHNRKKKGGGEEGSPEGAL